MAKIRTATPTNFNPHSREGSDARAFAFVGSGMDFNPHSREGSDFNGFEDCADERKFQSTLPRGE